VLHELIDVAGRPFKLLRRDSPFLPIRQLLWAGAFFVRDFA
jgi:hypothetical protein